MYNLSKKFLFVLSVLAVTMYSCDDSFNEAPFELPDSTPEIKYVNLVRTDDGPEEYLELTIDILDGDYNFGFQSFDDDPPFQRFDFVLDGSGERIGIGDDPGNPPFSCIDYQVVFDDFNSQLDTFLVSQNPLHYNIEVDFFVENPAGSGQFQLLDWRDVSSIASCGENFYGRFQDPNSSLTGTPFSFEQTGPVSSRLTYAMRSVGFPLVLGTRPFYIQCSIRDRALNQSNVITTPEMVFR